jgi:hypothetical protein
MPSYATYEEWAAESGANDEVSGAVVDVVERALEMASRQVDHFLGHKVPEADQLRIDTTLLTEYAHAALKRGVIAQATFRLQRGGEADMLMPDPVASVSGITFATQPRLCEEARELLADAGLYLRSGLAPAIAEEPAA